MIGLPEALNAIKEVDPGADDDQHIGGLLGVGAGKPLKEAEKQSSAQLQLQESKPFQMTSGRWLCPQDHYSKI